MKNILQSYLNIYIITYLLFLSYIAYNIYFFIDTKFNYLKTEIETVASKFGLVYQIYDDFTDYYEDENKNLNYLINNGLNNAYNDFNQYYNETITLMKQHNIYNDKINIILVYIKNVVEECYKYILINKV